MAQELVIMATFGERMLNPEYHDLGYTYMTQLDCKLRTAITEARVLFPSTQVQSEKLISLMVLVAENITPDITVDGFMKTFSYTAAFWPGEVKINPESAGAPVSSTTPGTNLHTPTPGNITVRAGLFQVADIAELDSSQHRQASTQPISSAAIPDLKRFPSSSSKKEPSQIIPESGLDASSLSRLTEQEREKNRLRLLFALEAYLMIPNPTALPAVTTTPISTLHSRIHHVEFLALSPPPSDTTISPTELSATLLHAWRGVTFEWTLDPTRHLFYDPPNNRTFIYSNIAFCFLHTLTPVTASTETVATVSCSSLYKNGFHTYHRLLAEIASTYRLLFGNDEFSHNYFRNIDVKRRGDGWYDIFEGLPKADTTPRSHYVVSRDFPMLGERLLVLKGMLRPTGLRELWRDKRDSLQWYTFWAVVFLGCVGIFMGMIQIVVGALQAWASMKALQMPT